MGVSTVAGVDATRAEIGAPGRVVGGVSAEVAMRLGVDPLWVRLTFVVLALFGGLGVVLYAGLWLMLIGAQRRGRSVLRYVGGAVVVIGGGLVLNSDVGMLGGPLAVAALLTGVALALWQPRVEPAPVTRRAASEPVLPPPPVGDAVEPGPAPGAVRRALSWSRPRRRPSVLGRTVLGLAVLLAAGLALIDELNGGRLHPEQWLGAAAAMCGVGLLIGALRGRAVWLVLPGLAFATAGYVSGHSARAGVHTWHWGDVYYGIASNQQVLPVPGDPGRVFGTAHLSIEAAPDAPRSVVLRIGIGEVVITVDDDVTLAIDSDLDDGRVTVDGVAQSASDLTVGPEGPADVTVAATISRGDVRVVRAEMTPVPEADVDRPPTTMAPFVEGALSSAVVDIGEGLTMGSDGTVLLAANARGGPLGAISPTGEIWAALRSERRSDGVTVVGDGEGFRYLVLPNQMVIAPSGILVDVPAARDELRERGSAATATTIGGRD